MYAALPLLHKYLYPLLHFLSLFWADIQRNEDEYSSEYKLGMFFPLVAEKEKAKYTREKMKSLQHRHLICASWMDTETMAMDGAFPGVGTPMSVSGATCP